MSSFISQIPLFPQGFGSHGETGDSGVVVDRVLSAESVSLFNKICCLCWHRILHLWDPACRNELLCCFVKDLSEELFAVVDIAVDVGGCGLPLLPMNVWLLVLAGVPWQPLVLLVDVL